MCTAFILAAMVGWADLRTWTDATGKFHVEARFVRIDGGNVVFQKADGKELTVPLIKLSEPDQSILNAMRADKATSQGNSQGKQSNASHRIPFAADINKFIYDEQTRLQAARPVGDPTSVTLFGGPASQGRTFVFLIDRSKSMDHLGHTALELAETEILMALRQLQPHHKFQVIAYHDECKYLNERQLLPATPENKRSVEGFLSGLVAFGATEHVMALQSALRLAPDVIYLLTDGGDPEMTEAQIRKINGQAGKTTIHCIQVGLGPQKTEDSFLSRLAALNRGSFKYVDLLRKK